MHAMNWLAALAWLLPGLAWAGDCHVANVIGPERLEGRIGEIITLSDRSMWELTSGPGYLGRQRGEVIVCPSSNEIGVGAQVLRVRRIERSLSAWADSSSRIDSMIKGRFNGWSGSTEFTLANGQVWRQMQRGYFSGTATDPKVRLNRKPGAAYEMQVEGFNAKVEVIRIR